VALSGNGQVFAIGSPDVQVYSWSPTGSLMQMGSSISNDGFDRLRLALNDDGSILAAGDRGYYLDSPHRVRIYEFSDNAWITKTTINTPSGVGNYWGTSIALSRNGKVMVSRGNSGPVTAFELVNDVWTRRADNRIDTQSLWWGALSLNSDGSIMAVGFDNLNAFTGGVQIFEWVGNSWNQLGSTITGQVAGDRFGFSVSLSGDGKIVAIGAPFDSARGGYAEVYELQSNNQWSIVGETFEGGGSGEEFGHSVKISSDGKTFVAGVRRASPDGISEAGLIRVFAYFEFAWIQVGEDLKGTTANEVFGHSVDISNNGRTVAAGSFGSGVSTAVARVYNLEG